MSDLIERLLKTGWGSNVADTLNRWTDERTEAAEALTAKDADIARLREALKLCDMARIVLDLVEELNPSNYDHDGVCRMNANTTEAWGILDRIDFQALGASHDA